MKKSNPFLSIVIPVFNCARDIPACINSLVENIGDVEYEILVVNNNSTDGTESVVSNMGLEQVKVLDCKTKGVAYARNMGIEKASGKYVTFCDADDIVDDNFKTAVALVAENDGIDVFQFPFYVVEEGKKVLGELDKKFCNEKIEASSDLFLEFLDTKISNSCWNKFFSLEFLKNNDILFKQFVNAEDMEFVTRCLAKCKSWFNGEKAYYHYIIRPNSAMTAVKLNKVTEALDACNSAFVFAEEIADATICLEQMLYIFGLNSLVCEKMDEKIIRLDKRLRVLK